MLLLLPPLLLAAAPLAAQRVSAPNTHGWFNYFGDHPLGESRWSLHVEGQWRRHDLVRTWQQLPLRPGVNFRLTNRLVLTGGYCYCLAFPYGAFPVSRFSLPEHRLWEQVLITAKHGAVAFGTRVRFENRFLGQRFSTRREEGISDYRFENRLRLLQRVQLPLTPKTYLMAYDEFWLYVPPYVASSPFDQNRAQVSLGVHLAPHWRVELGYLHQALLQRSGRVLEHNHTLVVSLLSNRPIRRP